MGMIEIPYETNKAGIRPLGALKGYGNGDTLTFHKYMWCPGSVIFLGFVAPPPTNKTGPKVWRGILHFDLAESAEAFRKPMAAIIAKGTDLAAELPEGLPLSVGAGRRSRVANTIKEGD